MQASTYTKTGNKATTAAKLNQSVFGVQPTNHELLKAAYVAYLANGRINLARTKTRGEVRGGGKKPWRQKGTGRARFGSIRVPIWRGGGVTFGPTGQENYTKKLNQSAKRTALRQALSLAASEDKIKVIETFENNGKTQSVAKLLQKLEAKGNILLALDAKDATIERATRNLASLKVVDARYINVFDVLNADTVLISQPALVVIEKWLSGSAPKSKQVLRTNHD